jgi:hypothetical protein
VQSSTAPDEARVNEARELFKAGVEHVKAARWGEALQSFEASQALKHHAITTFNIGACERALGRYTRARAAFHLALAQENAQPGQLAPSLQQDAVAFIAEIDGLLAIADVNVLPVGSTLTVDGRPLTRESSTERYVAGLTPPGPGASTPKGRFSLLLDPGNHVLTLHRKGYLDVVVRRTLAPGERAKLELHMEKLPASLHIEANVANALVRINGEDLGPVPIAISRPAGVHDVSVRKEGYVPYSAKVNAAAGQELDLKARLVIKEEALTSKWWFWVSAVAVLAGGAVTTYALTLSPPPPPDYEGGNTDWVAFPGRAEF